MASKLIFGLVSLVIIAIFMSVLFYLRIPAPNDTSDVGFDVTIKGYVTSAHNYLDNVTKPNMVSASTTAYSLNELCRQRDFGSTNITWKGDKGEFVLTLRLSVEQEIVLNTGCHGCSPVRVYISPNNKLYFVNLTYNTLNCITTDNLPNYSTPEETAERGRALLDSASAELDKLSFDKNGTKDAIRKTIVYGRDEIKSMPNSESKNVSFYHAYYSILFGWGAIYQVELAKLDYCLAQVDELTASHNDSCYIPPYSAYENYHSANNTFSSIAHSFNRLSSGREYGETETEEIKSEIKYVTNRGDSISTAENDCWAALRTMNESFEYQKPYCKKREIRIGLIQWLLVLAALIIGIYWGKFGRRWELSKQKKK